MNCTVCGQSIPAGARVCPQCGTLLPSYLSEVSPDAPTVIASSHESTPSYPFSSSQSDPYPPSLPSSAGDLPPLNHTQYGSTPNPYEIPPPPPPPKKGNRMGLIIGVSVGLVVLLVLVGVLTVFRPLTNPSAKTGTGSTPTAGPAQIAATATANASRNPYPPYTGTLVVNDPLHDNTAGYQWSEGKQLGFATCSFSGGAYHLSLNRRGYDYCGPQASNLVFSNLAFEANLTLLQGAYAGIWFRFDKTLRTRYLFFISSNGFALLGRDDNDALTLLARDRPVALRSGQQTNLLAVVAIGNTITMYVNNQSLGSVQDPTYQVGQIGVFAQGITTGFDLVISDVRVWKL